jgi:hypothetical protein
MCDNGMAKKKSSNQSMASEGWVGEGRIRLSQQQVASKRAHEMNGTEARVRMRVRNSSDNTILMHILSVHRTGAA